MLDSVTVVPSERVPELLPMAACIEAMEEAFRSLARGEVIQPLRTVLQLPNEVGSFLVKPGAILKPGTLGAKLLTLFPDNHRKGLESHQGILVLFDSGDGTLSGLIDAAPVTAIRTAAASAAATRLLAREGADELAILGSGVQARSHLEAVLHVRPLRRVRVWSPTTAHREFFAHEASRRHSVPVQAAGSPAEAVRGASIICTVTASPKPVIERGWIAEGAHINAVGASTARTRELDTETVRSARFYADSRESALAEAGDLLIPIAEGAVEDSHLIAELGEVLEGEAPGRGSPKEITIFKSLGMAVQDLAAARVILDRSSGS